MASCTTPDDPSLGLLVHCVRLGMIRHIEQALEESGFGINFSQFRTLKLLSEAESMTPSELARMLDHDAGALTRLLDRLQDKGYVRRKPRDDDRRVVDVSLSEAGRSLWNLIRATTDRVSAVALADLSPEEQAQLFALLSRVRQTLDGGIPREIA